MRNLVLLTLLGAFATLPASGAQTYRWVDSDGQVHYSDLPPPPSARDVERKNLTDRPGAPQLPYSLQQAMNNHPVTLYANDCGSGCDRARGFLQKRGIPYTEKHADDPAVRQEMRKIFGDRLFVPMLTVGRMKHEGFAEDAWNKTLDAAGYPRTALVELPPPPRPQRPAPPQAVPPAEPGDQPDAETETGAPAE